MNAEQMIAERPPAREQLWRLQQEIKLVQEPYIQILVDLYNISVPTITIADGICQTEYAPEVELQAGKIRRAMMDAIQRAVRYHAEQCGYQEPMR